RPTALRRIANRIADVSTMVANVQRLDPARMRSLETLVHEVHADDPVTEMRGDASGHVPDRPEPQHHDRPARRNVRVTDGLPCRRPDVGEVDVAVVGWT